MKSWQEKLNSDKPSQRKRIAKAFAGMPSGTLMYISTPMEIDAYVRKLRKGRFVTQKKLREDLATKNNAEATCPVTTGIFLRIVAEAAFEAHQARESGNDNAARARKPRTMTPFWRVIEPDSKLAAKLACGAAFIEQRRKQEKPSA